MAEIAQEETSLREVPASEILAKIEYDRPVDYEDVIINGSMEIGDLKKGEKFLVTEYILILDSVMNGDMRFNNIVFKDYISFENTEFNGYVSFDKCFFVKGAAFASAHFNGGINFSGCQFDGSFLSDIFLDVKFNDPLDQEKICMMAKVWAEGNGDRDAAGYYFYREMEARRRWNGFLSHNRKRDTSNWSKITRFLKYDTLEYVFIQGVFGYGVYPFRVIGTWLLVVLFLGIIYLIGNGVEKNNITISWLEYFYFSIVTAATPGYGGYTPRPGFYTLLAGFEAIFGTFMWAAFIATFARKYMR